MKNSLRQYLFLFGWFFLLSLQANEVAPTLHTDSFSRTTHFPKVEEAKKWKAFDWDSDTWTGFEGRPWIQGSGKSYRLIRHKRYVVNYDSEFLNPRWTAHINTRESALNTAQRPNSLRQWKRPSRFSPDPFLIQLFGRTKGFYANHDDFTNSGYSRGHMTSNAEMKGFDQESQIESFYTTNICPQLQDHNGGVWAELEEDCLRWAKSFGKVYVITGPVFEKPIESSARVRGKMAVPEKFFKVLIAEKDGKVISTGFMIEHKNGFKAADLFSLQVSVDEIEKQSRIDFMPNLGEPNLVETQIDSIWKKALQN